MGAYHPRVGVAAVRHHTGRTPLSGSWRESLTGREPPLSQFYPPPSFPFFSSSYHCNLIIASNTPSWGPNVSSYGYGNMPWYQTREVSGKLIWEVQRYCYTTKHGRHFSIKNLRGHSLQSQNMGGGVLLPPLTLWRRQWYCLSLAHRSFTAADMVGDQIRLFYFDRTCRFYIRSCTITTHNLDYRST